MKDRERIIRILNKLNDEELRCIYIFISGYTGYTGWEEEHGHENGTVQQI